MKKVKKILSVIMTAAMLLVLGVSAFATQTVSVGTGTGSITVTNATEGKTYRLYKLFDATYSDDAVSYSYTKTGDDDALFDLLTADGSPFTLTQVFATDTYVVTTEATASDISDWIKSNLTETDGILTDGDVLKSIASVEASESEIRFDELAFGYYFITSTLGTTITIDSNTPDKSVIDKNQGPSWDVDDEGSGKIITSDSNKTYENGTQENSVNVGDIVNFMIGVNTTNYSGDQAIVEYYINDSLGKGFEYVQDSLVVKIGDVALTKVDADPVVGVNYSVVWNEEDNSFRITIPWFDEDEGIFASDDANNNITVTYSATLVDNDDTVYAGAGNKNTATFDYRDTSDDPTPGDEPYHTTDEKETKTYTFALGFTKIDGKTKQPLPGAEFRLKNEAGAFIIATGSNGAYVYSGTTDDENEATTFTTDQNGQLIVKGVAEGTYTVIETKAPDGYNQLTSPVNVSPSIVESSTYSVTYTTYYDAEGNVVDTEQEEGSTLTRTYDVSVVELVIENNAGTVLPGTGGIGTRIIYIVGSLLVVGAVVILITRKRLKG